MGADQKLAVVAAHLRPAQGFGGVAESTAELIKAWRATGREVFVAVSNGTRGPPLSRSAFEQDLGAPVFVYRAIVAVRWGFGPGAPFAIVAAIRRSTAVYVSGIATWPATLGAYIAWALRKPYVVAVRGGLMPEHWREIQASRPLKRLFYQRLVLPSLRRARAIHVASPLEAGGVRALLPQARLVIAPNAFRPPELDSLALAERRPGGLKLLYLGRLSPEKGVLGFARAFVRDRAPDDQLTIVGQPVGKYGADLTALCVREPGLHYAGVAERDEIGGHMLQADALVLPSGVDGDVRENFGNVVVEALLHGRPVLVTAGLAWDELEALGLGVLFDRSRRDLPEALQRLRNCLHEGHIRQRCRDFALERYSIETVSDGLWRAIFEPLG